MNLLNALATVRNASLASASMRTRSGLAALRVIDKKLVSLMRKKAWRDCRSKGEIPIHMTDPSKLPPLPDDTQTAALRRAEAALVEFGKLSTLECAGDMPVKVFVDAAEALEIVRAAIPPQPQLSPE